MNQNKELRRKLVIGAVLGGVAAPFILPAGLIIGMPAVWAGAASGAALAWRTAQKKQER